MILTFRPLDKWPDGWDRSRTGKWSPFKGSYTSTLELLDRELSALGAKEVFLQVDVEASQIRLDGQLRSEAKVKYPGVILTIDTRKFGVLTYPCNVFDSNWKQPGWQANLRAIALGLEALRKVERYGIAERGQQYAGFAQIGSGIALGPHKMTIDEAARLLCDVTKDKIGEDPRDIVRVRSVANSLWREAVKPHHPDAGGDPEIFRKLTEARDVLLASSG